MKKFLTFLFIFSFSFSFAQDKLPDKIPCRINDENKNIMFMTLGNPTVEINHGYFYPYEDKVVLKTGEEIKNYFKENLKITFYKPIDKSFFPLPPSGWCSWYYYYQEISSKEVMLNADWLSNNLKDYGAVYCQIDDGWQGTGHGTNSNRDWTTIDKRFPEGMKYLADYIKKKGLVAGLWLAPHGQSNKKVVEEWNNFLLDKSGNTASDTWEGTYLVDPSHPKTKEYFTNLFKTLTDWGYDYFKIDGQPIVINEYKSKKGFMYDSTGNPIELYRNTLKTIKETIGPKRYLLGCWGVPLEGTGIMNGSRTYGDIILDWETGFGVAFNATMKYYFLHNIVWYCDPDVMLLRHPLTIDMARAWATLQGLTGQALLASDRLPDLNSERVEILKRVFPAVDIRPVDLFNHIIPKNIWDLKIKHLNKEYDVIGVFNLSKNKSDIFYLNWQDLGLKGKYHIYDFWNKDYLGAWDDGYFVDVNNASCRVLTLLPVKNEPQLISTNRHITQGWLDLLEEKYDSKNMIFSGKSKVIKDDIYELTFVYPPGKNGYEIVQCKTEKFKNEISNHDNFSVVKIFPEKNSTISWEVKFKAKENYYYPPFNPDPITYSITNMNTINIKWKANYFLYAGNRIYFNGKPLGITQANEAKIENYDLQDENIIEVATVWYDGSESENRDTLKLKREDCFANEVYLSDITPISSKIEYITYPYSDKSISGSKINIDGKYYDKGLGTHSNAEIVYDLKGFYNNFYSIVGLDSYVTKQKKGSVIFAVYGDDKLLWKSGLIKHDSKPEVCDININGVNKLKLVVLDGGDNINYDHADWGIAKIKK